MKCDRCRKPTDEESSRTLLIPGRQGGVTVCTDCYDEYCIIATTSKTILRRTIIKWFEYKALDIPGATGDSVPGFDETRHSILSIASGVMFELITEMVATHHIEGVIGVKEKMKELLADIDLALME